METHYRKLFTAGLKFLNDREAGFIHCISNLVNSITEIVVKNNGQS